MSSFFYHELYVFAAFPWRFVQHNSVNQSLVRPESDIGLQNPHFWTILGWVAQEFSLSQRLARLLLKAGPIAGNRSCLEPLDIVSIGCRQLASGWLLLPIGVDKFEKRLVLPLQSWFEFTSSLPQRLPNIIVVKPLQSLIPACKAKPGFGVTIPKSIERLLKIFTLCLFFK